VKRFFTGVPDRNVTVLFWGWGGGFPGYRQRGCTPHVSQNSTCRRSAIDGQHLYCAMLENDRHRLGPTLVGRARTRQGNGDAIAAPWNSALVVAGRDTVCGVPAFAAFMTKCSQGP